MHVPRVTTWRFLHVAQRQISKSSGGPITHGRIRVFGISSLIKPLVVDERRLPREADLIGPYLGSCIKCREIGL